MRFFFSWKAGINAHRLRLLIFGLCPRRMRHIQCSGTPLRWQLRVDTAAKHALLGENIDFGRDSFFPGKLFARMKDSLLFFDAPDDLLLSLHVPNMLSAFGRPPSSPPE